MLLTNYCFYRCVAVGFLLLLLLLLAVAVVAAAALLLLLLSILQVPEIDFYHPC